MKRKSPKKLKCNPIPAKDFDLEYFGIFSLGLTTKEIKEYLKNRAGVTRLGNLYKEFCRVAGINTMAIVNCEHCKKAIVLMYRHDVERFASKLLDGTPTYFD